MTKLLSIMALVLLAALPPCLASGASMAGKLREAYQTELETMETEALFKEADLARKYIAALEHLEQKLAAAGDLDAIVRIREEREAVEKLGGTTSHDDKPLAELREKYLTARKSIRDEADASRGKVTRSFTLKLQELETKLTKSGDVETALTLRKEREQLLLKLAAATTMGNPIGQWAWTADRVITIHGDGTFTVDDGEDGKWHWTKPEEREFTMIWDRGGYVDSLIVSADGKNISGSNNKGNRVNVSRLK